MARRVAIAIPARNEAECLPSCLASLDSAVLALPSAKIGVFVLANNCDDGTSAVVERLKAGASADLHVFDWRLPVDMAHAGVARRMALDAAAEFLRSPNDLLLSTDADTVVEENWLLRTETYFEQGYDAVAGSARLKPQELRSLPSQHRARLAALCRYESAIGFLRHLRDPSEPWPRHFYEGGASMALTLGAYKAIGGAPTPRVGEDKALFEVVRLMGGKVRHPMDVKVWTSSRLKGRAAGGTSDTLSVWGRLAEDDVIPGVKTIAENLNIAGAGQHGLTFRQLPRELDRARNLVRLARQSAALEDASVA